MATLTASTVSFFLNVSSFPRALLFFRDKFDSRKKYSFLQLAELHFR